MQVQIALGDPTVADALLDRLLSGAHRIELSGESMRKKDKNLTNVNAPGGSIKSCGNKKALKIEIAYPCLNLNKTTVGSPPTEKDTL